MIWTARHPPPPTRQWPFIGGRTDVPIKILHQPQARVSDRFRQNRWIRTDAILSLDDDASISTEEMEFAFQVWSHFSDRLVGFPSRSHFWDDRKHQWVSPNYRPGSSQNFLGLSQAKLILILENQA